MERVACMDLDLAHNHELAQNAIPLSFALVSEVGEVPTAFYIPFDKYALMGNYCNFKIQN